jgi:hypothetical protein
VVRKATIGSVPAFATVVSGRPIRYRDQSGGDRLFEVSVSAPARDRTSAFSAPACALTMIRVPSGMPNVGPLSLGYINESLLPRDLWMHRVDITRATGRPRAIADHEWVRLACWDGLMWSDVR